MMGGDCYNNKENNNNVSKASPCGACLIFRAVFGARTRNELQHEVIEQHLTLARATSVAVIDNGGFSNRKSINGLSK